MTRVNQPDTILTELREIKRRLHALETAARRSATNLAAPSAAGASPDVSGEPAPPHRAATSDRERPPGPSTRR